MTDETPATLHQLLHSVTDTICYGIVVDPDDLTWAHAKAVAREVLRAIESAGYRIVPEIATDEMVMAAITRPTVEANADGIYRSVYNAMVRAVPKLLDE